MDALLTMDEAVDCFESLLRDDPYGDRVAADLGEVSMGDVDVVGGQMTDAMAQLIRAKDDDQEDYDDQAHFFGPLLAPVYAHMGGPWVGGIQHPIIQQTTVHQPAAQQSSTQQPGPRDLSCPVHGCHRLAGNKRLDHLYDHLAEDHGYDKAYREYSVDEQHLGRKKVGVLKGLFIRDARKLAWSKARLLAIEQAIRRTDKSYVSCHGCGFGMPFSIRENNTHKVKEPLVKALTAVRNEINQKSRLYNQTGEAQSSWRQVYQNLIATFQVDQNAEQPVAQRAAQIFHHLRAGMRDNMADIVDAARVNRTHELVLKPGASLPPK